MKLQVKDINKIKFPIIVSFYDSEDCHFEFGYGFNSIKRIDFICLSDYQMEPILENKSERNKFASVHDNLKSATRFLIKSRNSYPVKIWYVDKINFKIHCLRTFESQEELINFIESFKE